MAKEIARPKRQRSSQRDLGAAAARARRRREDPQGLRIVHRSNHSSASYRPDKRHNSCPSAPNSRARPERSMVRGSTRVLESYHRLPVDFVRKHRGKAAPPPAPGYGSDGPLAPQSILPSSGRGARSARRPRAAAANAARCRRGVRAGRARQNDFRGNCHLAENIARLVVLEDGHRELVDDIASIGASIHVMQRGAVSRVSPRRIDQFTGARPRNFGRKEP